MSPAAWFCALSAVVLTVAGCGNVGAAAHPAPSGRGSAGPTGAATPAPMPAKTAPATPAPEGAILVDVRGSGSQSSAPFQAPATWTLHYSFDCSALSGAGRFQVDVRTSDAQQDPVVLELAAAGASTVAVSDSGSVRLEVSSQCAWHLTATG